MKEKVIEDEGHRKEVAIEVDRMREVTIGEENRREKEIEAQGYKREGVIVVVDCKKEDGKVPMVFHLELQKDKGSEQC